MYHKYILFNNVEFQKMEIYNINYINKKHLFYINNFNSKISYKNETFVIIILIKYIINGIKYLNIFFYKSKYGIYKHKQF